MTTAGAEVEEYARAELRDGFTAAPEFDVLPGEPLEVRHSLTGETFMLEVRALSTGG